MRLAIARLVTALLTVLVAVATVGALQASGASRPSSQSPVAAIGTRAQRSNVPGLTTAQYMSHFVVRHGSRLSVDGKPFRFTGGNTEWLGLENYGPNASKSIPLGSERYPTHFEIDDAFATLHEMGANVVRAQTLGDTIGCSKCLEPSLGHFNEVAFRHMDWVVADARRYGIKSIAPHQLFIDIYGMEYYPHWFPVVQGGDRIDGTAPLLHLEAANVAAAHKVYATIEWGWDNTDFLTTAALKQFLAGVQNDPNVEGENFWALYYTGLTTKSNTASEMATRAQIIRHYAYLIDGFSKVPAHERVPAPIITALRDGRVYFEGAAGAVSYSVEQLLAGKWRTACHQCVGNVTGYWSHAAENGCYRMLGIGISGATGPVSRPAGRCPVGGQGELNG